MSAEELIARDSRLIWHPYSQHGLGLKPIPVRSASGAYVELADGKRLLDAISSWWVTIHGHGHPAIQQAIARQAMTLDHVLFAGFTHEPAVELAQKLVRLAENARTSLARVFYSDNGSTAVEAALKIAFQFHHNQGRVARTRFVALRGSYHGDTLGAMAVAEPEGFHRLFRPLLPQVDFIQPGDLSGLERLLGDGASHAAFIFEPLIQGASGMRMYPARFLREAVELCSRSGVLTIADEVFTGFHRTGTCFAFEQASIQPDLLCLSKGITGGFLPLGATLATEEIFDAFKGSEIRKAFLHGHSYTANPISCAAANANLRLLEQPGCLARIRELSTLTATAVARLAANPRVRDARSLGTIGAIDRISDSGGDYYSGSPDRLVHRAMEKGVLLRPMGSVLYAVPPYCVTDSELLEIYDTMEGLLHD